MYIVYINMEMQNLFLIIKKFKFRFYIDKGIILFIVVLVIFIIQSEYCIKNKVQMSILSDKNEIVYFFLIYYLVYFQDWKKVVFIGQEMLECSLGNDEVISVVLC